MDLKRGDLITIALQGDFGKPRPAVVIQSDLFNETHATLTVLPITSENIVAPLFRIAIEPSPGNGLRKPSQIMVDKAVTVQRAKIGPPFGRLDNETLLAVTRALAVFLGI